MDGWIHEPAAAAQDPQKTKPDDILAGAGKVSPAPP